jgi:hypothetical protein
VRGWPIKIDTGLAYTPRKHKSRKMSSDIVFASNFRTDRLTISAVKTMDSGAKQAYVNYDGKKFLMQTPIKVSVPYGLNVYEKPGSDPEHSISISFRGYDAPGSDIQKFHAALSAFDEFMIEEAYKNRKTWFKGVDSKEVIRAFYTPTIKIALDKQGNPTPYPPTMKAKIRKLNGQPETKFYNEKGVPYSIPMEELLQKGTDVTAILQCAGLWFAGGKFGVTWRAIQVIVHKIAEKLPDFAFKGIEGADGSDADADVTVNDDDVLRAAVAVASVASLTPVAPVAVASLTPQHDTDDEGDGEDIDEIPVPKPKTVIKKKIIAKPAAK